MSDECVITAIDQGGFEGAILSYSGIRNALERVGGHQSYLSIAIKSMEQGAATTAFQ